MVRMFETEDGFRCRIIEDGVLISAYRGDAEELTIPAQIDGRPVIRVNFLGKLPGCVRAVALPEGLVEIENSTFAKCALRRISIPLSVRKIGGKAFGSSQLEEIVIPDSVTELGEDAFCGCKQLKSVRIGKGVQKLDDHVFAFCERLERIEIGRTA